MPTQTRKKAVTNKAGVVGYPEFQGLGECDPSGLQIVKTLSEVLSVDYGTYGQGEPSAIGIEETGCPWGELHEEVSAGRRYGLMLCDVLADPLPVFLQLRVHGASGHSNRPCIRDNKLSD